MISDCFLFIFGLVIKQISSNIGNDIFYNKKSNFQIHNECYKNLVQTNKIFLNSPNCFYNCTFTSFVSIGTDDNFIYINSSDITFDTCYFNYNSMPSYLIYGGIIFISSSKIIMIKCSFESNTINCSIVSPINIYGGLI